ncbi:hypothetical protein JCM3774_001571 [Rhodotorula dairenensis]
MLPASDSVSLVLTSVAPILLGSCFSCVTCGLLLSLVARYWTIFGRDACGVRPAVAVIAAYSIADTAVNCSWAYHWAVTDFVSPQDLTRMPWQVTAFCILCVQAVHNWSQVPRKIMQTNAPSTVFQVAIVCLHFRMGSGLGFIYLGFCSSKIYLGSFVATCNARDPHGSLSFDETVDTCRLKGLGPSHPVHVAVEQERRIDGDEVSMSTAGHGANLQRGASGAGGGSRSGGKKRLESSLYRQTRLHVDV